MHKEVKRSMSLSSYRTINHPCYMNMYPETAHSRTRSRISELITNELVCTHTGGVYM